MCIRDRWRVLLQSNSQRLWQTSSRPLADTFTSNVPPPPAGLRRTRSPRAFHHLRRPRGLFSVLLGYVSQPLQVSRQTVRRLVLLGPPRCLNTDQKPFVDDPPATTSSVISDFNSSGTGVFVLQSLGKLFRPRARFAAYPAARHVTRATRHVMRAITPCYACHPDTLRTRPSVAMYPSTLHRMSKESSRL